MPAIPLYLTLDVDWAPTFVIDEVASILLRHRVHATWYVTHASPAIDRLRRHADLFELGIHPNFHPGSSHGQTPKAVLEYCMALVPEAVSMRSHGQLQSSCLVAKIMRQTPVDTDCSYMMPRVPALEPACYHVDGRPFLRIPSYFEDDVEMAQPAPNWNAEPFFDDVPGLKVLTFHPLHVYLNGATMGPYEQLKQISPHLAEVTQAQITPLVQDGAGPGQLFRDLVERLQGISAGCIRDLRTAALQHDALPLS